MRDSTVRRPQYAAGPPTVIPMATGSRRAVRPIDPERTHRRPSGLGFGGANVGNLGSAISEHRAAAVIDRAWECGIRYFDTAPHYGSGLSERRLGRRLAARPRHDLIISTKVGRRLCLATSRCVRTTTGSTSRATCGASGTSNSTASADPSSRAVSDSVSSVSSWRSCTIQIRRGRTRPLQGSGHSPSSRRRGRRRRRHRDQLHGRARPNHPRDGLAR